MAKVSFDRTTELCDQFLEVCNKDINKKVEELMNEVQYNIMKIAMKKEIGD